MKIDKSDIAKRIKNYESLYNQRLMPQVPVVVRIDGKSFHTWTKNFQRPYSASLHALFDYTTEYLVDTFNAVIGYTQSDEITLIFEDPIFNGKTNKLNSVLASATAVKFNQLVAEYLSDRSLDLALFDCRSFSVPSRMEAVNCLVWREIDAVRNSVSMAAQSQFEHKELQGKSSNQMQEMLFQKGINFNDYPTRFKRGAYFKKVEVEKQFTNLEISKLPSQHDYFKNPDKVIKRRKIVNLALPQINKISNKVEVVFDNAVPILYSELKVGVAVDKNTVYLT